MYILSLASDGLMACRRLQANDEAPHSSKRPTASVIVSAPANKAQHSMTKTTAAAADPQPLPVEEFGNFYLIR